jgi:hypothetical protein
MPPAVNPRTNAVQAINDRQLKIDACLRELTGVIRQLTDLQIEHQIRNGAVMIIAHAVVQLEDIAAQLPLLGAGTSVVGTDSAGGIPT